MKPVKIVFIIIIFLARKIVLFSRAHLAFLIGAQSSSTYLFNGDRLQ